MIRAFWAHGDLREYVVLVTSLAADLEILGQLYRDRGDAETHFDEIKNHLVLGRLHDP